MLRNHVLVLSATDLAMALEAGPAVASDGVKQSQTSFNDNATAQSVTATARSGQANAGGDDQASTAWTDLAATNAVRVVVHICATSNTQSTTFTTGQGRLGQELDDPGRHGKPDRRHAVGQPMAQQRSGHPLAGSEAELRPWLEEGQEGRVRTEAHEEPQATKGLEGRPALPADVVQNADRVATR
jgi:hypothetical protein